MKEFYQSRKSQRTIVTSVLADHRPLYGGLSQLGGKGVHPGLQDVNVPLNLTFVVRSRAYVLGKLVKPKFYRKIRCLLTLDSKKLGKPIIKSLKDACEYH
ncbi:hypothetical protein MKW94_017326 [Papaver nudicaule]|uniref:Uncharacterized protein n=1 Tax=Papaver nudicaule TaxID=74823 RepID=A0AA41SII7_PAPNU|nr:hypothetical protein [Papaver nudicaule]